jgi:hypothetical protein
MNLSDAQIAVLAENDQTKLHSRNASANLVMGPRGRASANYTTRVSAKELTD